MQSLEFQGTHYLQIVEFLIIFYTVLASNGCNKFFHLVTIRGNGGKKTREF